MSGFERSAPVKGSQGPRRSEMVRFNNAPPAESPWRLEVLEAKRQAEAARKQADKKNKASRSPSRGGRRSRSRSRQRERDKPRRPVVPPKDISKVPGGPKEKVAPAKAATVIENMAPEKGTLLRQLASSRGDASAQGWYAAVARASEAWESVDSKRRLAPAPYEIELQKAKLLQAAAVTATPSLVIMPKDVVEDVADEEERRKRKKQAERPLDPEEEKQRREADRLEQQERDCRRKEEAEAMERRNVERRLKAEEERRVREAQEKKRRTNLKGAFAVDDDDDDETESKLPPKADRRREVVSTLSVSRQVPDPSVVAAVPSRRRLGLDVDEQLGNKLGFENVVDPADAFIRLQERKRKGRRAEFGGPPRNCSPWRDGKRGVVTPLAQHTGRTPASDGGRHSSPRR